MILEKVTEKRIELLSDIVALWEASVRKTHTFLSEEEMIKLRPLVSLAVKKVQILLVAKEENGTLMGFMGIENKKIEMLFVSPAFFGKRVGKALLLSAVKQYHAVLVDVNEQNTKALEFYKRNGFFVVSRSQTDKSGNPFPILHMKWGQAESTWE